MWNPWSRGGGVVWGIDYLEDIRDDESISLMFLTDSPTCTAAIFKGEYRRPLYYEDSDGPISRSLADVVYPGGLCITDLRDWSPSSQETEIEGARAYYLDASHYWVSPPKGYHTSGWEMLCLLETEGQERRQLLREMYTAAGIDKPCVLVP